MNKIFDISLYNDEFFQWHYQHAREYSIKTMDWFLENYKPSSVCDIGCGIGSYLEAAYHKGIDKLQGFDIGGEAAKKYTPAEIQPFIEYQDCTQPITLTPGNPGYDTVISFETAEHIDPAGSATFVKNICKCVHDNGLVLFTAAPPGQEGTGHINCQPQDYWINLFRECHVKVNPGLTRHISTNWQIIGCPKYIVNNLIVLHHYNKR